MAQERGNVMDEDELPPENGDPFTDPDELAGLETELPESAEVPPAQVQERLEAPTGSHSVGEALLDVSVADGSFEADAADWVAVNATVSRSTEHARSGAASGLLTVTGSPAFAYARPGEAARAPVSAATDYLVTADLYSEGGDDVELAIDWFDSAGGYLTTNVVAPAFSVPPGAWLQSSFRATSPVGAAFAAYGPTVPGSPAGGTEVWFDNVLIFEADGNEYTYETDPATRPGVTMTWTEPDPDLLKRANDGPSGESQAVSATGGTP